MKFKMLHANINVLDIERSVDFYKKALSLQEVKRTIAEDGSYIIVYMQDEISATQLELTWLSDKKEAYELGDNESHIAFEAENYDEAHKLHTEMGCICFENKEMGIYFIEDPDGYWQEIVPAK